MRYVAIQIFAFLYIAAAAAAAAFDRYRGYAAISC